MSLWMKTLTAVLVLAMSSIASAQVAQHLRPLVVVDSNDRVVGEVVDIEAGGAEATVVFQLQNLFFESSVSRQTVRNAALELYFESDDCSGTGYGLFDSSVMLFVPVFIKSPGSTLYVTNPQNPTDIETRSVFQRQPNGTEECRDAFFSYTGAIPAVPTGIDLEWFFTPPFRVTR